MYFTFPNGTTVPQTSNASSWALTVYNGTAYYRVKWEQNWVCANTSETLANGSPSSRSASCLVYILVPQTYDINLLNVLTGTEIRFYAPNSTWTSWQSSNSSGCVQILAQNGTWDIQVRYSGGTVNETSDYSLSTNIYKGSLKLACEIWTITITAKDSWGTTLTVSTTAFYWTFPNGTTANHNSTNGVWAFTVFAGTNYYRINYQNAWVTTNTTQTLTSSDTTLSITCQVYSLTVYTQDKNNVPLINVDLDLQRNSASINGLYSLPSAPYTNITAYYKWTQLATGIYTIAATYGTFKQSGTGSLTADSQWTLTIDTTVVGGGAGGGGATHFYTATVTILLDENLMQEGTVQMYDSAGKQVWKGDQKLSYGSATFSSLTRGDYTMQVYDKLGNPLDTKNGYEFLEDSDKITVDRDLTQSVKIKSPAEAPYVSMFEGIVRLPLPLSIILVVFASTFSFYAVQQTDIPKMLNKQVETEKKKLALGFGAVAVMIIAILYAIGPYLVGGTTAITQNIQLPIELTASLCLLLGIAVVYIWWRLGWIKKLTSKIELKKPW